MNFLININIKFYWLCNIFKVYYEDIREYWNDNYDIRENNKLVKMFKNKVIDNCNMYKNLKLC